MTIGRTPPAAARALRDVLQRAVSCVSAGVLISNPLGMANELLLTDRLRSADGQRVLLSIEYRYVLLHDAARASDGAWRAQTAGYLYTLREADGREILGYHWHPSGRSPVTTPHLHLGAGAGSLRRELVKAHLATGFVTPVAVLALVVEQFDVRPRRADWIAVLEQARYTLGGD